MMWGHIFMYLLSICMSSLAKCLFSSFAIFKSDYLWGVFFFAIQLKESLYILDFSPLADTWFANIFSQCFCEGIQTETSNSIILLTSPPNVAFQTRYRILCKIYKGINKNWSCHSRTHSSTSKLHMWEIICKEDNLGKVGA